MAFRLLPAVYLLQWITRAFAVSSLATCFWPDGSIAAGQTPCVQSDEVSFCCGLGDACLSNKLCLQQGDAFGNRIARGSCTASDWGTSIAACPTTCDKVDRKMSNNCPLLMVKSTADGEFCCGRGYNETEQACTWPDGNDSAPFNLAPGRVIYDRSTGSTILPSATKIEGKLNVTTLAAGIAIPLSILLIAAILVAIIFLRKKRRLESLLKECESELSVRNESFSHAAGREYTGPHGTFSSDLRKPNLVSPPASLRPELPDEAALLEPDSRLIAVEVPASPPERRDMKGYVTDDHVNEGNDDRD